MLNKTSSIKRITLLVLLFAVLVVWGLSDLADARSSSGGRSFGGSSSAPEAGSAAARLNPLEVLPPPRAAGLFGGGGNSFLRGVGGGLVGGMIGNMLFGRSGYAGGGLASEVAASVSLNC